MSSRGGYVAEIPDLKCCITQAETKEEIVGMIEDAKKIWLIAALKDGKEILWDLKLNVLTNPVKSYGLNLKQLEYLCFSIAFA